MPRAPVGAVHGCGPSGEGAFNWTSFDLDTLAAAGAPKAIMTHQLSPLGGDGTQALLAGMGV